MTHCRQTDFFISESTFLKRYSKGTSVYADHFVIINMQRFMLLNQYFFKITERRPLKPQLPTPLFRSPSTRLIQRDMLDDDRGSDPSNLGSLGGSIKEMHHYTFQPSKQIVSKISF